MIFNEDEIKKIVLESVADSLALEVENIKESDKLINDLGMDSLDFLDIMFSLERAFKTKIRDDSFDRLLKPDKSEMALQQEFLAEEEIDKLSDFIPNIAGHYSEDKIPRKEIFTFITVETLIRMVISKLN